MRHDLIGCSWDDAKSKVAFLRPWGEGAPDDIKGKAKDLIKTLRFFFRELAHQIAVRTQYAWENRHKSDSAGCRRKQSEGHMRSGNVVFWSVVFILAALCYGVAQPLMVGDFGLWAAMWDAMLLTYIVRLVCKMRENERKEVGYDCGRRRP